MKFAPFSRSVALLVFAAASLHGEVLLEENFEAPDATPTSVLQDGATYAKEMLPSGGKWIGSALGFGADRKGLIHKSFGDFSAPLDNNQGIYFGYTKSGITSSSAAISKVLEPDVKYILSFDVARDNDKTSSSFTMEFVAFPIGQGDAGRNNVQSGSKPGVILASLSSTVTSNDLSSRRTITFTSSQSLHSAHFGKPIGVRFIGNTSNPILDNVKLTAVEIDSDRDGLLDEWELAQFGDLSQNAEADPDNDRLSNAFEYEAKLNPNNPDTDGDGMPDWIAVPNYLSAEVWNGIPGAQLSNLYTSSVYAGLPSLSYYIGNAKSATSMGDDYGIRLRGTVKAPYTGSYRFWIAGNGESVLHLSTDASLPNRRQIAAVPVSSAEEGWDESPEQESVLINLVKGKEYFIEVLMKAGQGTDHLAVAWEYSNKLRHVIPGTALKSFVEIDTDIDGLPDRWELTQFGDLSQDGNTDTDADRLSNAFEYEAKLNPNNPDTDGNGMPDWMGVPGYLSVDEWADIPGAHLSDLFASSVFYGQPGFFYYVPEAKGISNANDNYGIRLRGTVKAPYTGQYRFWLSGNGESLLSLSTDSTPFKRRRIAAVPVSSAEEGWDDSPNQKSVLISLVKDQEYFIEALMKAGEGSDHLAVAWEYTGQARQVIPKTVLKSFVPSASDADDDGMLDTWETQVGLRPNDNGLSDRNQSGYLDVDGDDLLSFEEYLYGGKPLQVGGHEGYLEWNMWSNLPGTSINDMVLSRDFTDVADLRSWLIADTGGWGANYGGRWLGVFTPPVRGDYYFHISGDDATELWLSPTANRFEKHRIAWNRLQTDRLQWNKYVTQKSAPVRLSVGQPHYIEALLKNGSGADHLSIGWSKHDPVENPWVATNIGLAAPATWTEEESFLTVSSRGGNIWYSQDQFTFRHTQLTGDGVLIARIPSLTAESELAKVGLMIRASLGAGSQNVMVLRTGGGRIALQSRGRTSDITLSGYRTDPLQPDTWLRIARVGNKIQTSSSEDGINWKQFAEGVFNLPATAYIGFAVAGIDANKVDAVFDNISITKLTSVQLLPSSALTSVTPDANDKDDDSLPDNWERQKGLDDSTAASGMGQFGDPDSDGVSNLEEYQFGGNPLVADGVPGHLVRELWNTHPSENIYSFVRSSEFLAGPNLVELHSSAEFQKRDEQAKFGQRVRGSVVAPVTGNYRFWISGAKDFELWLSTDATKFNKRKIASALQNEDGADARSVQFRDWDKYSSQSSKPIYLNKGDKYFMEILHKDTTGQGHFSVGWSYTDETTGLPTVRKVIDPTQLRSYVVDANDADNDYLPDTWETEKGLSAADNGYTDTREGEYSDYDADGLTNREEWLLGADPTDTDTDDDGVNDFDEARRYYSNPTVADNSQEDVVAVVPPGSVAHLGTKWLATNDGAQMQSFRGEGTWNITVPTAGFWIIRIDTRLLGELQEDEIMPVNVKIDGTHLTTGEILYKGGNTGFLRVLSGYLSAGSHELELFFDNYMARRQVEVTGISILKPAGADTNQNGMPDLMEQQLLAQNKLSDDRVVVSHVSPVFIDGLRRTPESFELRTLDVGSGSTTRHKDSYWNTNLPLLQAEVDSIVTGLVNQPGVDRSTAGELEATRPGPGKGTWFSNLELQMNQATAYTAFFENGVFAESGTVVWSPLNVVEYSEITIPVGSELLMGAWLMEADDSSLQFSIDGQLLERSIALQAVAHRFDTIGHSLVTVLHETSGMTYKLTVHVEGADFPSNLSLGESRTRLVQLPRVEPHLSPDSGGQLIIDALRPATEGGSQTYMGGLKPGSHRAAVRMPTNGQILDIEEVNVVGVSDSLRNDADRAVGVSDGLVTIQSPLLLTNLPPGGYAVIKIFRSGVTFLDGTTVKTIRAEDLDEYGVANIGFYFPVGQGGGYCHYVDVHDAEGNLIYHGN